MSSEKIKKRVQKGNIPLPRFHIVRDAGKGRNAWKLFSHWQKIKPEFHDLIEVRIYRTWPEIDVRLVDPKANFDIETFVGACPFSDQHGYIDWVREKHGSGGYRVSLNETGVPGEIQRAYFEDRDEIDKFPPKLDIRTLVRGAEANKYYEAWCHRNGVKLPWENEGDEDMGSATGEALRTVMDAHTKMADKALEMTERVADARIQAAEEAGPDPRDSAHERSIQMVTHTAEKMVEMATERAGKQYDAVEMLKAAGDLVKNNGAPAPDNSGMLTQILQIVQQSNDRVITLYEKQADTMSKLVLNVQKNQDGSYGPGSAVVPAKSFVEQASEYKRIAELFGWSKGSPSEGGGSAVAPQAPQAHWFNENTAPIIMLGFQTIMVLAANVVYNWSSAKFKIEGQKPQDPQEALKQAAAMTTAAQNGAQHDQQQQTQQTDAAMWQKFIEDLEGPFVAHFYVDPPAKPAGYTLAHFLLSDGTMANHTQNGRKNYLALKRLGRKNFDMLVRGHHSLWSKVQGMPAQYNKFIDEFFTFDEFMQAQEAAKSEVPATASAA